MLKLGFTTLNDNLKPPGGQWSDYVLSNRVDFVVFLRQRAAVTRQVTQQIRCETINKHRAINTTNVAGLHTHSANKEVIRTHDRSGNVTKETNLWALLCEEVAIVERNEIEEATIAVASSWKHHKKTQINVTCTVHVNTTSCIGSTYPKLPQYSQN